MCIRDSISDSNVQVMVGDLTDATVVRRALTRVETVYHCALDSRSGGQRRTRAAIRVLIEACARQDAHLLYPSCAMIENGAGDPIPKWSGALAGLHRPSEVQIEAAGRDRLLRATRLRFPPLIGAPLDLGAGRNLFRRINAGAPFLDPGLLARQVEYLDRRDAARFLILAGRNAASVGQVITVPACGPISRRDFLTLVAQELGKPLRVVSIAAPLARHLSLPRTITRDRALAAGCGWVRAGNPDSIGTEYQPVYTYHAAIRDVVLRMRAMPEEE